MALLLGCDGMQSGRNSPTFLRNVSKLLLHYTAKHPSRLYCSYTYYLFAGSTNILYISRICGFHRGGCEEFYLLGYSAV
jgi:hypothetical protein